jgi:hypothetical protein
MNDVRSRKTIALRQFRIAGPAAAEKAAFGHQLRSGCAMDGAAHAAAWKQRFVCGIYNRVNLQGRDIGLNGAKRCGHDGKTPCTVGGENSVIRPACQRRQAAGPRAIA